MNIADPIHFHASKRPDHPAVISPQGQISWRELDRALWCAAAHFHANGLAAGDRVGMAIQHPVVHLIGMLGLARIGVAHAATPLSEPANARAAVAERLKLKAIVTDVAAGAVPGLASVVLGAGSFQGTIRIDRGIACTQEDRTWLLLQSSGTTGAPKYAELSHAMAMMRSRRFLPLFQCGIEDRFWPVSRLDFVVAKQRALYALHSGAAVCLPVGIPIGPPLMPFLRCAGVTLACGTPAHLHHLLALSEQAPALASLRGFEARSATVSEPLREAFRARFSPQLYVVYGTNEGEALTLASPDLQQRVKDTVGTVTASLQLELVDDTGEVVPAGAVGQVRVRGPGVITEYLENTEASGKAFRQGWFYPGDFACFTAEGALILKGRTDDMMIFDGMNIYPAEIENVLIQHPAVADAAAFPIQSREFQDVPAAAVILREAVSAEELARFCSDRIGIKSPRMIRIVDSFPRNAMGKILKRELR